MKMRIIILSVYFTALGYSISFAQKQKPVPTVTQTEIQHPYGIRSEEKKEELSKKLVQRKNELRKEEHEHNKERRNFEVKEKSNSPK